MSTEPATAESSRRRRPTKAATVKPTSPETGESVEKATRPPRPRIENIPVPEEAVGKQHLGRISDVIRKGQVPRPLFGFINMADNVEPVASVPRIYFKRMDYSDPKHIYPRRGYQVLFTVSRGEDGKFFATNVVLTEKGKEEADANKLKADEAKAAKLAAAPPATKTTESKPPAKKNLKPRKPRNDTVVTLQVTLEGSEGSQTVEAKIGRQLGVLKRDTIKLFGAEGDFTMNHVSDENPAGVFLTTAILKTLKDGDRLHFAKKVTAADA